MAISEQDSIFLQELLITPSPTGFEQSGQRRWLKEVSSYSDRIVKDPYGSAAVVLETKEDRPLVILEAHCDEIGMMVQYISDDGFVYITRLGGSDPTIARGKKVNIHTKQGVVTGLVGNTAIHLQDRDNPKPPKWHELYIDIGVTSKEEALQLVQIGDPITYVDDVEFLNDQLVVARALDNRVGSFIIAQAFKQLAHHRNDLFVSVAAVNSVQEEIGGFGARMMTHRLSPSLALVTDVTHATDTPGINVKEHGSVKLGEGPTLTHGSANHPGLVSYLETIAGNANISVQHEATSIRTGTDTDSIFFQNGGIPSALISLPLRYMHSPIEMAHLDDIHSLISLMVESVLHLKEVEQFSNYF